MAGLIDETAVRHVAHLARLKISDEEVSQFAHQLSAVLDYVAKLSDLDTDDVPPTAHPLPLSNVLREDRIAPTLAPSEALKNAPQQQDGFFRVPKVLGKESA